MQYCVVRHLDRSFELLCPITLVCNFIFCFFFMSYGDHIPCWCLAELYDSFWLHSSASTPSNVHISHAASSMGGSNSMPSTPLGPGRPRQGSDSSAVSANAAMTASALAQVSCVLRQNSLGSILLVIWPELRQCTTNLLLTVVKIIVEWALDDPNIIFLINFWHCYLLAKRFVLLFIGYPCLGHKHMQNSIRIVYRPVLPCPSSLLQLNEVHQEIGMKSKMMLVMMCHLQVQDFGIHHCISILILQLINIWYHLQLAWEMIQFLQLQLIFMVIMTFPCPSYLFSLMGEACNFTFRFESKYIGCKWRGVEWRISFPWRVFWWKVKE